MWLEVGVCVWGLPLWLLWLDIGLCSEPLTSLFVCMDAVYVAARNYDTGLLLPSSCVWMPSLVVSLEVGVCA